jgi:hypothetical protein
MDGFGREEDMGVGRWDEGGYTDEEDRSERLLCAATLLLLKGGEECLSVDQATRVRYTGDRSGWAVSKGWEGGSAY